LKDHKMIMNKIKIYGDQEGGNPMKIKPKFIR